MALADLRNFDMQDLKRRALQMRELASGLAARVRYSRTWWYSGAAILLGLSLARFGHSVTLYMVSKSTPLPPPRQAVAQNNANEQMFSDPTITVGGALFQRAGEGAAAANAAAVVEQPAKPFKLTATLEGSPEFARALIEVQGEGIREYCAASRACSKKEKDCECTVQNATIISIAQEHIWIKLNQNRYKLKIGQSTTDLAQQVAAAPAAGQPAAATSGGSVISKVLSREDVNKNILGNPAKIYEGAQFGPHLVNGKIEGYKIARVNDDHIFAKLGAKSGDIIRKVNGYGLNDTERMLDLWKAIRTAPEVKIELERDGKVITYDFQIRN